jgi:predicted dehydrogenase
LTLRVALAGAGFFGRFQAEAWRRIEGVELVAIADREPARAAALGVPRAFDDVAAMLDGVVPDLLDIATPEAAHGENVAAAMARRVPCVCQKPLAPSLEEAQAMARAAAAAGVRLIVHENWRFQPWYREARRLLDRGALGRLHNLTFALRPGDGRGPSAYLDRQPYFQRLERFLIHETAIHLVDTFRYLAGEVTGVVARLRRLNPAIRGEDAGHVLLDLANGAVGLLDGNRLNEHLCDDPRLTMGWMLIEGSEGRLRLDGFGRLWLKPVGRPEHEHAFPWRNDGPGGGSVEALQRHVVAALRSGRPAETEAALYLRNLEIEAAIYRSAATGAWIALD